MRTTPAVAPRAPTPKAATGWASPNDLARFVNGMARKEGTTQAGIDWFTSGD